MSDKAEPKPVFVGKLAVRADRANGVVRAFFSSMDGTQRREVATLAIDLADTIPGLFDRWVSVLSAAHCAAVEAATGVAVAGVETRAGRDPGLN